MNKFQPVDFASVEDMLDFIPAGERQIVQALRELVKDCIPHCEEKLSYNVPYYYRHKRICFIWPGSVPWGKVRSGVQLGFVNGPLLHDETNYLERGDRKTVYGKTFNHVQEVLRDAELIRTFLFEAAGVDEQLHKSKSQRKPGR